MRKLETCCGILLNWTSLLISRVHHSFILGANEDFQNTEELASACSMHRATTEKDIIIEMQKTLQKYNLQWDQLQCATIDGGKNMAGVRRGLMGEIRSQMKYSQISQAMFIQ